mmetsp:Transcript_16016/g.44905  ORF Transcript_16016/g.44905 Transcript_16016/m.44905 type:complete len:214 (+) Transcript_16016:350-991(+)
MVHPDLMLLVTAGIKSFFLETRFPRSMIVPSALISPLNALDASDFSHGPHSSKLECNLTMLTIAKKRQEYPRSFLQATISGRSSSMRSMMTPSSVVSTTANPTSPLKPSLMSKEKLFWSPFTKPTALRPAKSLLLALNCRLASDWMSLTSAISDKTATMSLSHSVVVGPSKLRVSERMAQSNRPATLFDGRRLWVRNVWAMMVDMLPQGRMSM